MPKIIVTCCQDLKEKDRQLLGEVVARALLSMEPGTLIEMQDSDGEVSHKFGTCPACEAAREGYPRKHTGAEYDLFHKLPLRHGQD